MLETGVAAWPLPSPPDSCLLPRSLPCQRARRDVQARLRNCCSSFFPRALPAQIPQTLPQAASGEHPFADYLAAAANRCAPRARAPRAKTPGKSHSRAQRERKIFTACQANSNTSARSAERNFLHAVTERTSDASEEKTNEKTRAFPPARGRQRRGSKQKTPPHGRQRRENKRKNASVSRSARTAAKRKANEKMRAFPPPHGRQRRENTRKNASVSPSARTPTKRKHTKKCERFPCPTDASEEKTSEKMRAFPLAHERSQAQKHPRARAQSADA